MADETEELVRNLFSCGEIGCQWNTRLRHLVKPRSGPADDGCGVNSCPARHPLAFAEAARRFVEAEQEQHE